MHGRCVYNDSDKTVQDVVYRRRGKLRDAVRLLLRRGADPNASSVPMEPLLLAIPSGDVDLVTELLLTGANPQVKLSESVRVRVTIDINTVTATTTTTTTTTTMTMMVIVVVVVVVEIVVVAAVAAAAEMLSCCAMGAGHSSCHISM